MYTVDAQHLKQLRSFRLMGCMMHQLFVNENLTQPRKELFWRTKQKAKDLGYRYIWTNNGQIYLRKKDDSKAIIVNNPGDIETI